MIPPKIPYYVMPGIEKRPKQDRAEEIIQRVCGVYKTSPASMRSKCRIQSLVFVRHVAIYLIRTKTKMPVTEIGRLLNRDHSTVLFAIRQIENYLFTDDGHKRGEIEYLLSIC